MLERFSPKLYQRFCTGGCIGKGCIRVLSGCLYVSAMCYNQFKYYEIIDLDIVNRIMACLSSCSIHDPGFIERKPACLAPTFWLRSGTCNSERHFILHGLYQWITFIGAYSTAATKIIHLVYCLIIQRYTTETIIDPTNRSRISTVDC